MYLKRLKDLREDYDKKQHEIAKFLNITRQQYSLYETGKRDPDLLVVKKIANYFNVSIEFLCGEDVNGDLNDLVTIFNKLSDESKKESLRYITYLYEKENEV